MELTVGIPFQILVVMALPAEFLRGITKCGLIIMAVYAINGVAKEEVIPTFWIDALARWVFLFIFGKKSLWTLLREIFGS